MRSGQGGRQALVALVGGLVVACLLVGAGYFLSPRTVLSEPRHCVSYLNSQQFERIGQQRLAPNPSLPLQLFDRKEVFTDSVSTDEFFS